MEIDKLAIIGTGSMGSMMSLLFAQHGCQVSIFDPSKNNRDLAIKRAKEAGFESKVKAYEGYDSLCDNLGKPKVFLLSVPHGTVGDSIVEQLHDYLQKGDVIIDGSNEHWENTQRRQGKMTNRGVHYIGMGVSGGYQSARSGPSMSPGGDEQALDAIMPLLKKVAAQDTQGNPCVAKMGPGGSGHYVKMIHNGIEQGMMSALCEAWGIMHFTLGMPYEEIASTFEQWNTKGELNNNFLISIAVDICRQPDPQSKTPLLDEIRDKVVQDVDESEGTGVWTCEEGMRLHVPIPTIAAAHQFRLASAYSTKREHASKAIGAGPSGLGQPSKASVKDKASALEDLRQATYASFLASFVQGLSLLARMDDESRWDLDFASVIAIWRGGCIIRSEAISELLLSVFQHENQSQSQSQTNTSTSITRSNLLSHPSIAAEFKKTFPSLKRTVLLATEADAHVPATSASLEYLKYATAAQDLPTSFMEAELDFFGHHMFEIKKDRDSGKPVTGPYHFGWRPAKGVSEDKRVEEQ
ncbi:MAG: hypothetical protein LQ340_007658 [Diploschistes diacapsis]|nr:MAG: hypothetical protein LQ340_007658 [Diploschistes diacapsis]